MHRFVWKRFRYYLHRTCGGILRDRDQKSGELIWRCFCGVELGRTLPLNYPVNFLKRQGRNE